MSSRASSAVRRTRGFFFTGRVYHSGALLTDLSVAIIDKIVNKMRWPMLRNTLEGLRSLVSILRTPDDTKQVFRLVEAMSGGSGARVRARLERSRAGSQLLAERPEILPVLEDTAYLE